MKFLCDVHIPYKLKNHLKLLGFEVFHVNEILDKWVTSDSKICFFADQNDLIVITKDADFRNSYYITKSPKKLIKINLGNVSNNELVEIFSTNLKHFKSLNKNKMFIVEMDKHSIHYNT